LELQETLRATDAALPVIIITGHGDIAMAVRAMKVGASDFIEKPFNEQVLLDAVHRALAQQEPAAPPSATRAELETRGAAGTPRGRGGGPRTAGGGPEKGGAARGRPPPAPGRRAPRKGEDERH